jgi:dienelactone hydrolase
MLLCWSGPTSGACARPFKDMARRMAAQGYAVLTVNPFYRDAKAPIVLTGDNPALA